MVRGWCLWLLEVKVLFIVIFVVVISFFCLTPAIFNFLSTMFGCFWAKLLGWVGFTSWWEDSASDCLRWRFSNFMHLLYIYIYIYINYHIRIWFNLRYKKCISLATKYNKISISEYLIKYPHLNNKTFWSQIEPMY